MVGDAGAGAEQEGADGGGGDVGDPVGVGGGDGVVGAMNGAVFQVEERYAVTDAGEFTRGGQGAFADSAHEPLAPPTGARVIRPHPYAFALPSP